MSKLLKTSVGCLMLLLLMTACKKDTSWNSSWVVPLVNDKLDLSKFVNDSTIDGSGVNYVLDLKRTLYNFSLTDIIAIPDTTIDRAVHLNSGSISVSPGFTFYNSVEEHELQLKDAQLKLIQIQEGYIDFELENPVGTGVYITVELPGVTKYGVTLSKTFFIKAGTQTNPGRIKESISIADHQIDLRGINGDSYNRLQSLVKIKSDPDGVAVSVTSQDLFHVKSKFRNVELYYARGYFGKKELADTAAFNVDLFNKIAGGTIDIPNTVVKLKMENGIKMDGTGLIKYLKSTNKQGTVVNLSGGQVGTTFTIDQPTGSFATLQPSMREIIFNSGNSNIEAFLENLGVKNELGYAIKINPWGNVSGGWNEVFPQSRLRLTLEAQMPLTIKLDELTIRDTFAFNLNQKKDKSHIESGVLQLDLDNAFPFEGKIKLLFLNENDVVIETVNASQPIISALYGEQNSQGLWHKVGTMEVPLSIASVEKLSESKQIVIEASFSTPDPVSATNQMVAIPVNAYLGVKAKAKFQLKMKM